MAKNKVPKKLMGFKLRKGTRKDLKQLLRMVAHPGHAHAGDFRGRRARGVHRRALHRVRD